VGEGTHTPLMKLATEPKLLKAKQAKSPIMNMTNFTG